MILNYSWVINYLGSFIKVLYFLNRKFTFPYFAYEEYKKSSDIPVLNTANESQGISSFNI